MDPWPGWWLRVSTALCHRPPQMIPWLKPYGSCCSLAPKELQDLQALTSLRMWFWPSWRVGHHPEPQCWWTWLEVPCLSELQHTFCQLARLTWGWWLDFFHPILEDLGIGQGLLGLLQSVVLSTKLHIRKGQKLVPVQRVRSQQHWIVVGHLLGVATHLLTEMMPRPSSQTPGHHSGRESQGALATMLGCWAALHATWPTWNYYWGRALAAGSAGSHLPLLLWPGNPSGEGQGEAGTPGPHPVPTCSKLLDEAL